VGAFRSYTEEKDTARSRVSIVLGPITVVGKKAIYKMPFTGVKTMGREERYRRAVFPRTNTDYFQESLIAKMRQIERREQSALRNTELARKTVEEREMAELKSPHAYSLTSKMADFSQHWIVERVGSPKGKQVGVDFIAFPKTNKLHTGTFRVAQQLTPQNLFLSKQ